MTMIGAQMMDDPRAPEFYTSSFSGFSIQQGNITLTFESARCNHFDPTCSMTRVVVGRVTMPLQAAQSLVLQLNDALTRVGMSPSSAATLGMAVQ
jgi:hypothetical protein